MLQLTIERTGERPAARVSVNETTSVGSFVASFVDGLKYPRVNAVGQPIVYQLRMASNGAILPHAARFSEMHIASGTHLVLEVEGAENVTISVAVRNSSPASPSPAPARRPVTRRSLLAGGASLAFLGLGSGFGTALAQERLFLRPPDRTPVSPVLSSTLRGAETRLTFSAHQRTVRTVGWSPDGSMLASGADDGQLLVWSPDGAIQQRISHPAPVQSLAWSPESQRIVSSSANQITFLTALTGNILASRTRHTSTVTSVQWTSKRQMQVVSGALDKRAIVWDSARYQPQAVFTGHDTPIEALSWGSDGQVVASTSQGGVVRLWNAGTAREIHGFYQDARVPMRACAFAPAGAALAVGGNDGVVRIWNGFVCQQQAASSGGLRCTDEPQRFQISAHAIRALAWSPDGRYLAIGNDDGSFSVYSLIGDPHHLFSILQREGVAVHSIAWSADGRQLSTASGNTVVLWLLK